MLCCAGLECRAFARNQIRGGTVDKPELMHQREGQIKHFVKDDNLNIFRLPVAWQWLVNSTLGGALDPNKTAQYGQLVQTCLQTGATDVVDIHKYARWGTGLS